MLQKIRKSKTAKLLAIFFAFNFMVQLVNPAQLYALTGGPSQPEVQSFEPIGTSEMVNAFSGDFNYNIPLMDVGGYPINMSYHSGVTMDQEASWVGLGWNINSGAITRNMRGLPDDFNGDPVTKEFNIKANKTYTATPGLSFEFAGVETEGVTGPSPGGLGLAMGISYNNYTGVGVSTSINPSVNFAQSGSTSMTAGLGINSGPDGLSLSPSVSLKTKMSKNSNSKLSMGLGTTYNSRSGLQSISANAGISESPEKKGGGKSENSISAGGGSSISLGGSTYVPSMSFPMVSTSISISAKLAGLDFVATNTAVSIGGSYSENRLATHNQSVPAYGYNRSENGQNKTYALMDFNREKDMPYSRRTPTLPVTNLTYDIYSIAGQGVGGMYRPYRSDVGYVYDKTTNDYSSSGALGVEVGVGNVFHVGVDVSGNSLNSSTGKWISANPNASYFRYRASNGDVDYEPYYFKQVGEKSVESSPAFVDAIHGDDLLSMDVAEYGAYASRTTGKYNGPSDLHGNYGAITDLTRDTRQRRTLSVSKLNQEEAKLVGLNASDYTNLSEAQDHHNTEFTVTKNDGARYVYGMPLLNHSQEEVVFNASGRPSDCNTGMVSYQSDDASTGNDLGVDSYYSSTTLPAYNHSYLLTAVLSVDYVDSDGVEGPSDGDIGSYTKFTYGDKIDNYRWRVPYKLGEANFEEGYRSLTGNEGDDKGSFVYGTKELKYLTQIETRTHVAVFTLSDRNDAFEAAGRDGGLEETDDSFRKLDQIDLYTKPDYDANVLDLSNATPVKTVNFVYDYSLCPGVPNNDGKDSGPGGINEDKGKLTLKEVYFTYQNSNKGKLNPYKFTYSDENPTYDLKGYDRWGNYKENSGCSSTVMSNVEFPYTDQETADTDAESWSLTDITLPSGGEINIAYEADDYAYVQDRKAYQMFKVTGVESFGDNDLGDNASTFKIFFDDSEYPGEAVENYYTDIINRDKGYMYFNFMVDIRRNSNSDEFVKGYCKIKSVKRDGSNRLYVEVESIKRLIGDDHPISKAAWQFGRLNIPRVIYNQPATSSGIFNVIYGMATAGGTLLSNIKEMITGPDGYYRDKDYGEQVNLGKSCIRLMNPTGFKKGGGARVSTITMQDNWDSMSDEQKFSYGQEYDYTMIENGATISSGVAANEPQIGGDESVLKHPIFFGGPAKVLAPDGEHYVETPMGESFYPSAGVGYRRVSVSNIKPDPIGGDPLKRHATGHLVHEFYTAKDFPVKWRSTIQDPVPQKSQPITQIFNFNTKDYMTVSQGYLVELNDMHGKPKAQYVYPEDKPLKPISSVVYHYKQAGGKLDNTVTVINNDGTIDSEEIGVEYDMVADFRESETNSSTAKAAVNLEFFFAAIFPITVPPIWPGFSSNSTRFRSAVTTKVVNRFGILEKTVATDLGSKVETKNLAYDAETGEVLLTETINDFNDPVYNFTYPVHWSYDRMGPAYKNIGLSLLIDVEITTPLPQSVDVATATANDVTLDIEDFIVPGDELLIEGERYWAWEDENSLNDGAIYIMRKDGSTDLTIPPPSPLTVTAKVIRSGRRNLQTTSAGTITSLKNPLGGYQVPPADSDGILYASTVDPDTWDVLHAEAIEFSEKWKTHLNTSCHLNKTGQDFIVLINEMLSKQSSGSFANDFVNEDGVILSFPTYSEWLVTSFCSTPDTLEWKASVTSSTKVSGELNCDTTPVFTSGAFELEIIQSDYVGASFDNLVSIEETYNYNDDDFIYLKGGWPGGKEGILKFTHSASGGSPSMNIMNCPGASCGNSVGKVVNPYVEGLRGNWRAQRTNLYLADREQTVSAENNLDIRYDGVYSEFSPFYVFKTPYASWTKDTDIDLGYTNWTWTAEVTEYNPYGVEIENRDKLDRYSSAVYGYDNSLPILVAKNAQHRDVAFDGFEDYSSKDNNANCDVEHFDFHKLGAYMVVDDVSHTGKKSIHITAGESVQTSRNLTIALALAEDDDVPYTLKAWDNMGLFEPITYNGDKEFLISYWVKEDLSSQSPELNNDVVTYDDNEVIISIGGSPIALSNEKKTAIIDGWQKVEYEFTILGTASGSISIALLANNNDAYFDDIRIQPINSSMKSYVYDEVNYRLMAELDENNFATFYEYDEEGALTRIKKETERGIVTIQESRNSKYKQPQE